MARRHYSSIAQRTTLSGSILSGATTIAVVAVTGFPATKPYTLILDQDTVNEEVVTVTASSGTTLTVTRGVDGTTGVAHSAGATVNHGVSARDFDEPNAFINGTGFVSPTLADAKGDLIVATADDTLARLAVGTNGHVVTADSGETGGMKWAQPGATPTQNAQTGTTYTAVLLDAGKTVTLSNASAVTLTIPAQASVSWADNTQLNFLNIGAGTVTITAAAGVTINGTPLTLATSKGGSLIRTASDAWTFIPFSGDSNPETIEYLIIAGGGGSSDNTAGGGGAGGYRSSVVGETSGGGGGAEPVFSIALNTVYTVTVGSGGAGGATVGANGSDSSAFSVTATGGGGGGEATRAGTAGGSGGGGSFNTFSGGAGTTNQGFAGGNGAGTSTSGAAGGGGGATAVGTNAVSGTSGNGGAAKSSSITGSAVSRAGGGGGAPNAGAGAGTGGGGGASNGATVGVNATANTGSGAGGARTAGTQASGGSGVVIVRHLKSLLMASTLTGGSAVISGDYLVYTFNASGTIGWS